MTHIFYGLSDDKAETKTIFLSSRFPISAIPFPIVKAAATVPIPKPSILPSPKKVSNAVTVRQVTSKLFLHLISYLMLLLELHLHLHLFET